MAALAVATSGTGCNGHRRMKLLQRRGGEGTALGRPAPLGLGLGLVLLPLRQHPSQPGIAPPVLLQQLPAGLDDSPPRQRPLGPHSAGIGILVFAGRKVFGEHGDLGRRRDGPAAVVLVEEVVAVADGLAERSILKSV